ncbi:MAG: hypothetical protein R3244_09160 [Thermoanaerobaculia bacterium]|nr:hypothetical protein [Thermoanaerobaculia bacterium]
MQGFCLIRCRQIPPLTTASVRRRVRVTRRGLDAERRPNATEERELMGLSFKVGQKVVYPNHGVAIVEKVEPTKMGETEHTPALEGTTVEFSSERASIILGDSDPVGWTITLTAADGVFEENSVYNSDNETNRVGGTIEGPESTCTVAPGDDGGDLLSLQTATFPGDVPSGFGTFAAPCFGAPEPGASFSFSFGPQPGG